MSRIALAEIGEVTGVVLWILGLAGFLFAIVRLDRWLRPETGPGSPRPEPDPWLLRIQLVRVYAAPVLLACLFFPWAVETSKPLLVPGKSELQTGWELQGKIILTFLAAVASFSFYSYVARPRVPRPVGRAVFSIFLILLLQIGVGAATGGFITTSYSDYQPAYEVAQSVASLYWLSILAEALVLGRMVVRRWRRRHEEEAPPPRPAEPNVRADPETREVVLLIHGTGAADPEDAGPAWWQAGSPACAKLSEQLPAGVRCHEPGEVFHWSGRNSEAERVQAGRALHDYLRRIEARGVAYHLVGHSHGGSVVMHALKRATRRKRPLENLRSWTTLGTPFFRYAVSLHRLPLLLTLVAAAVLVLRRRDLIEDVVFAWPRLLEEGYYPAVASIVALAAIASLVVGYSLLQLIRLAVSVARSRSARALEARAMERYGDSWNGLWSRSDEAIGGLQRATSLGGDIVLPLPSDTATAGSRARGALTAPLRFAFNHVVRPVLDDVLWNRLRRHAQGNDSRIAEVEDVLPWPEGGPRPPPLPDEMERAVVEWADRHAAESVSTLRPLLGTSAVASVRVARFAEDLGGRLTGRELVHWSYYHLDPLLERTAAHIRSRAQGGEPPRAEAADAAPPEAGAGLPHRNRRRIAALLVVGIQVSLLAGLLWMLGYLDRTVLDRFLPERQVKEALYASFAGSASAALRSGNVRALEDFRTELAACGLSMSDDPRIELLSLRDLLAEGRLDAAARKLPELNNPFFAVTAYVLLNAARPGLAAPEDVAMKKDLEVDYEALDELARRISAADVLDPVVRSAAHLRAESLAPDVQIFGRFDLGWLKDSTTAAAYDFIELATLHLRGWTGDVEAIERLRAWDKERMSIPWSSLLEMQARSGPADALDDPARQLAVTIARGPFRIECRDLPRRLLAMGKPIEIFRIAQKLRESRRDHYGDDESFDRYRYFALTTVLDERVPLPDGDRTPVYPMAQVRDLQRFEEKVEEAARRILQGTWDPQEALGLSSIDGLGTYAALAVANRLLDWNEPGAAAQVAWAVRDFLGRSGGATPRMEESKRLAILFARLGDLYVARRIGEAWVEPGDRLEVWTAILRAYRLRLLDRGGDPETRIPQLWQEVDRERGMVRTMPRSWNRW